MVYRYYLVWGLNASEVKRPLLREHNLDIEVYRGNSVWELSANYGGIFWGDIDVDKISEDKANSIIKLKDK